MAAASARNGGALDPVRTFGRHLAVILALLAAPAWAAAPPPAPAERDAAVPSPTAVASDMPAAAAMDEPATATRRSDAAEPASAGDGRTDAVSDGVDAAAPTYPVQAWNRTIATMSIAYDGVSPATRARNASRRLDAWLADENAGPVTAEWVTLGGNSGMLVAAGSTMLFGVLPGDAGHGEAATEAQTRTVALRAVAELERIRADREAFADPARRVRAVVFALLVTALAFAVWYAGSRVYHRLRARWQAKSAVRAAAFNARDYDFWPIIYGVVDRLAGAAWLLLCAGIVYLWLGFVLKLFPYTRPWGETLGGYVRDAASGLLAGFVTEIPSLLTLALIWLVTHAIAKVVGDWFEAVRTGVVDVDWFDPAAAAVSARLAKIGIWLFALTIAYPYIPGADTDAFKGVSVLFGLMISIGSAGVIGQMVSGIVAVYTRAVRVGDMVRIGEHEGTVTQMGVVSLKLANRLNEEFTIPNAMLSSAPVQNFTRLSSARGLILSTSVTIGYDAPWRQVHAMLLLAAARTPDLLREPRPLVLQKALSDFYVEYVLLVTIAVPQTKYLVLSALHANIQDAFNEFGVQIMSPNFEAQPDGKVWVPRERWHDAPAAAPADLAPGLDVATDRATRGPEPGTPASTSM